MEYDWKTVKHHLLTRSLSINIEEIDMQINGSFSFVPLFDFPPKNVWDNREFDFYR